MEVEPAYKGGIMCECVSVCARARAFACVCHQRFYFSKIVEISVKTTIGVSWLSYHSLSFIQLKKFPLKSFFLKQNKHHAFFSKALF